MTHYKTYNKLAVVMSICLMLNFSIFSKSKKEREEKNERQSNASLVPVTKKSIGDKYFESFAYKKAIDFYEYKIKKGDITVLRNLAESYWKIHDTKQAQGYYEKLLSNRESVEAEDFWNYAQVLKSNKYYKSEIKWVKKYHAMVPGDSRAEKILADKDYYKKILNKPKNFSVENLDINTEHSEFGVTFSKDNKLLVASSKKPAAKIHKRHYNWNDRPWLDIHYVKQNEDHSLKYDSPMNNEINTKFHEAPGVFSNDGNSFYFTRSNFVNGEKEFSRDNVNHLQIVVSQKTKKGWSEPKVLPFSDNHFSTGHPTLSNDGKTLYFSSDRPNGYGGSDIYFSVKKEDGTWSDPKNMGSQVNTEGDELFPYVHESGLFFFASDGYPGLGGLDLYFGELLANNKVFGIENLGYPVNSENDDFGFVLDSEMKYGYLSSNREGGKGSDDIYSVEVLKPLRKSTNIFVKVQEMNTLSNINQAVVYIKSGEDGSIIDSSSVNEKGEVAFSIKDDVLKYTLYARAEGYDNTVLIPFSEDDGSQYNISKTIEIPANVVEAVVPDFEFSDESIEISFQGDDQKTILLPLAFDYNSSAISESESHIMLDETYEFLLDHPDYDIHIKAHTDCRGKSEYNQKLSEQRAEAIMNYMIEKGIELWRLSFEGMGEEHPVVICDCELGPARGGCTEEEHYENRRSEVVISKPY